MLSSAQKCSPYFSMIFERPDQGDAGPSGDGRMDRKENSNTASAVPKVGPREMWENDI